MNPSRLLPFAAFPAALLLCALGGCSGLPTVQPAASRVPPFQPKNFIGDTHLPSSIRRVVVLPVHGGEAADPESCEALDPVFVTALEKQMRFEVVVLSRAECEATYGVADMGSANALPHDFLETLASRYGAQAVMFIDVTSFYAYRPLSIGVRAKLASVSDQRLVWSFDQVYSVSDPAILNSLRRYYLLSEYNPAQIDVTSTALMSPTRFAAYVADTTFRTLPPR